MKQPGRIYAKDCYEKAKLYRTEMKTISFLLLLFAFSAVVTGCGSEKQSEPEVTIEGRWFSEKQYETGKMVYTKYCASCHGINGQSTAENWKRPNPDGTFPPPPLNGSAHTWHHPFHVLMKTIDEGGIRIGGTMPAFGDQLSEEEKIALIAFFQGWWDDKTYERWVDMNADQ